jgi:hypothetical protein
LASFDRLGLMHPIGLLMLDRQDGIYMCKAS